MQTLCFMCLKSYWPIQFFPIIKPIEDGPFGRVFSLRNPDGYAITIHGGN
jgi:hypothetical protein